MRRLRLRAIGSWFGHGRSGTSRSFSRQFLEKLINAAADPIFTKDRQHRWLLLNDACCNLIGAPREALIGKSDYDVFSAAEAAVFWEQDERVFSTGEENINEELLTDLHGVTHTVVTKKSVVTDRRGNQVLVGLLRDVTLQKAAEQKLRENEILLQNIVDHVPAMISLWDRDLRNQFVNRRANIFNLPPEQFRGRPLVEIIGAEAVAAHRQYHAAVLAGENCDFEMEQVAPSGEVRHLWIHFVPDRRGDEIAGFYAYGIDVTERRLAEEAHQRSEDRFRDYAETASDWFWETGPDHRFTYISERITAFGLSPARLIGRLRWEIAADLEEAPEKWRRLREAEARHEPFRGFTYKVMGEDGLPRHVAISGKPVFDTSGKFLGYRGVSSDVTAAVRTDQALREAKEQQILHQAQKLASDAERLELLGRLVDIQEQERLRIARELHDQMSQDLTGLSLGLKKLEASVGDESGRETLRWLQALTTQTGENVHRIAWELRPTSLDDLGLVRALETYIADWSERFGLRVDFHAADAAGIRAPPMIETTAYRLVQEALTNVVRHARASAVSLVLECKHDQLQIIIEDDGTGLEAEAATTKGRLGLAGMRERLALVGGSMTIESTGGIGTTLYFRMPLAPDGTATKA